MRGCCGMTVARLAVFRNPLQINFSKIQESAQGAIAKAYCANPSRRRNTPRLRHHAKSCEFVGGQWMRSQLSCPGQASAATVAVVRSAHTRARAGAQGHTALPADAAPGSRVSFARARARASLPRDTPSVPPGSHDERQTEVLCGRSHNDVGTIGLSFPQAIGAHSRRRVS